MNFEAAIFDLDGTLLNSMDIWEQIDISFLNSHALNRSTIYESREFRRCTQTRKKSGFGAQQSRKTAKKSGFGFAAPEWQRNFYSKETEFTSPGKLCGRNMCPQFRGGGTVHD